MIFALGGINEREMKKLQDEADALGKSSFSYAFFTDRQAEERRRGVTITVTTKEFFTASKHFTILDNPGHRFANSFHRCLYLTNLFITEIS